VAYSRSNRIPTGNYIVMLLMSVVFAIQFLGDSHQIYLSPLILENVSFKALLGYFWLHTGPVHIVSNLALLAVFGRDTCIKMGYAKYFLVYILLGFSAAVAHVLLDGRPVIGASGAIFGILGLAVVLSWRKFSLLGPWLVFIWFAFSVAVAIVGNNPIAHVAHIAGFMTGMILAIMLIIFNQVDYTDTDYSLMKMLRKSVDIPSPSSCRRSIITASSACSKVTY
jgi:membrane associated rhomboid family serine protease